MQLKPICYADGDWLLLEVVSKPQIRSEGKAQTDDKAEHIQ
jgi:hypothetical protein